MVLHAGDMPAAMEKIAWHMDDPRVGMCHQNWYVAKLASRFVKVCLAGAGGDELFGGYPWRYRHGLAAATSDEFDQKYFDYWHRLLPAGELPQLFVPELWRHSPAPRESFDGVLAVGAAASAGVEPGRQPPPAGVVLRDEDLPARLPGDRRPHQHGARPGDPGAVSRQSPGGPGLADSAVAEGRRRAAGRRRQRPLASADGKRVLRRAMRRYLPEEFTNQPKQGFSPPDENWYRGPSMDYIKSVLFDKRTLERPWFDQDFVRQTLGEHFAGQAEPPPVDLVAVEPRVAAAALHRPAGRGGGGARAVKVRTLETVGVRRSRSGPDSPRHSPGQGAWQCPCEIRLPPGRQSLLRRAFRFAKCSACSRGIGNSPGK